MRGKLRVERWFERIRFVAISSHQKLPLSSYRQYFSLSFLRGFFRMSLGVITFFSLSRPPPSSPSIPPTNFAYDYWSIYWPTQSWLLGSLDRSNYVRIKRKLSLNFFFFWRDLKKVVAAISTSFPSNQKHEKNFHGKRIPIHKYFRFKYYWPLFSRKTFFPRF